MFFDWRRLGVFCLFCCCVLAGYGQFTAARSYVEEDGLASNYVTDILQDHDGVMWYATLGGLSTFDGFEWQTFSDHLGLPKSKNTRLYLMEDSSIVMIGVKSSQLEVWQYKDKSWSQIKTMDRWVSEQSRFEYQVRYKNGELNVAIPMEGKLAILEKGTWTFQELEADFGEGIRELVWDEDDIWIYSHKGIFKFENKKLRTIIENVSIIDVLVEDDTTYLLGTDWIGIFHNHQKIEKIHTYQGSTWYTYSTFLKDGDDFYYSGYSELRKWNRNLDRAINLEFEIFEGFVIPHRILIDHEHNLWIATTRGVAKSNSSQIQYFNKYNGLLANEVSAIYEYPDGRILLGGNRGYSIVKGNRIQKTRRFSKSNAVIRVMDIVEFDRVVYMASSTKGLLKIEDGRLIEVIEVEGDEIIDLSIHGDNMYALTQNAVYQVLNGQLKEYYQVHDTTKERLQYLRRIVWMNDQMYLLSTHGILDVTEDEFITSDDQELNNLYTMKVYQGHYLLGSLRGISMFEDGKMVPVTDSLDIGYSVYEMMVDQANDLWIGTSKGLFKWHDGHLESVDRSNGLASNETNRNALVQLRSGEVLVGTDKGVSIIPPDAELRKQIDPIVQIQKVDGREWLPDTPYEFVFSNDELEIQFKTISYYDETKVNYRYRLTGSEEDWNYLPDRNQRSASYTRLSPGEYLFEVQARIGDSDWSENRVTIPLIITPLFYQIWYFQLLIGVLFLTVIFGVLQWRTYSIAKSNRQLQTVVEEKTSELRDQNEELKETLDKLKTTQATLIDSEKMASVGLLTAGLAHEINNPMNWIKGGANSVVHNFNELREIEKEQEKALKQLKYAVESGQLADDKNLFREIWERLEHKRKEIDADLLVNETVQLLNSIQTGADRTTDLIKSLRSFTVTANDGYQEVHLEDQINMVLQLVNNKTKYGTTVTTDHDDLPKIWCIPTKINQVLLNIILNAIDAIPDKGGYLKIKTRLQDESVMMEVIDNGIGVKPELLQDIYEPFYTTKDGNAGLGLTIARSIIHDHGGKITAESDGAMGTIVRVLLPLDSR